MLAAQFSAQSALSPDHLAVVLEDGSKSLSFSELDNLSDELSKEIANAFRELHDDASDSSTPLISLMTNRNLAMIISILGILKSGSAYVPVDPSFPPDRQSYIFAHSNCKLLLCDPASYAAAVNLGVELPNVLVIDSANGKLISRSISNVVTKSNSTTNNKNSDLAYVLYTSGSTGKPKGVMVTNVGVSNIVQWFANEISISSRSVVLGLTTYCFDISVLEMFMPLLYGGTLVIADSASQKDPFRLLDVIKNQKVNVVQATPTTYEMMLATGWKGDKTIDFLVGGEAFRPSIAPLIKQCRSLRNVYGPTETTIWSSCYNFRGVAPSQTARGAPVVPIGTPISQTYFYVVAVDGEEEKSSAANPSNGAVRLVPRKEPGELWIGGVGVAKGYIHAPDLTAQRFLPNPFDEGMVYRTGDLVQQLEDGNYVFIRRLDDQVKVNGYRIELAEIEVVYSSHPLVEQAVVIVRHNRLLAYLKPQTGAYMGARELQDVHDLASRSLTHYMIPKDVVVVESFPKTANGKLDRNALPDPPQEAVPEPFSSEVFGKGGEAAEDKQSNNLLAHRGEGGTMVDHICNVVERVRGQRPLPNTSFARIGIDSLGAVIFLSYLSDSLGGIRISPNKIFGRGVTVASFAADLQEQLRRENPKVLEDLDIVPTSTDDHIRMERLESGSRESESGELDKPSDNALFEDRILANRDMLEGLRGLFMLFVLWDHYRGKRYDKTVDKTLLSDTDMFVIVSGFTTALQFRHNIDDTEEEKLHRKPFNLFQFLRTRAIGIFPCLWLALILNSYRWHKHDIWAKSHFHRSFPPREHAQCIILYIVGLQGWSRPLCHYLGPNDTLYASILWSCFIMYAIIRVVVDYTQRSVRKNRAESALQNTSNYSLQYQFENFVTVLSSNRLSAANYWKVVTGFFILFILGFSANSQSGTKAPIAFITAFMAGVVGANIFEATFHRFVSSKINTVIPSDKGDALDASILPRDPDSESVKNECWKSSHIWILNVLPDAILMGILLMFSNVGGHRDPILEIALRSVGVTMLTVFLLISLFMQPDNTRWCITRNLLLFPVMRIIGYASYPIYLLQQVTLNFYFRMIYDSAIGVPITTHPSYGIYWTNEWAGNRRPWWKPIMLCIVVSVGYVVQFYFQDRFVPWLLMRVSSLPWNKKKTHM